MYVYVHDAEVMPGQWEYQVYICIYICIQIHIMIYIYIYGINAEVISGQWEYQVGPLTLTP
jgi:glutamine synthetase